MKQKLIKIIGIILALIVIIIGIASIGKARATNPNSEKIAKLTFQLSELEYSKMYCLDNLTYKQSIEQEKGINKYCIEYDEDIMLLQAQIDELSEWKAESETETAGTAEVWTPGTLTEDGDHQLMPPISETISDPHERFKELASAYSLDASKFRTVENHYGIKEGVILCITIAETSGGWRGYGKSNPGNVGNNDRGDRIQYAFYDTGLEKIGQTLTNQYLGKKQTLGCLSNAGSCSEVNDNGKRYATSNGTREKNMSACLGTIYGKIDASTFIIRR